MNNKLILFLLILFCQGGYTQEKRFQQKASYRMEVDVDVKTYKYKGTQEIVYQNNSSDTLYRVFYHLYNNAFQPGSEMDVRLQTIADPDKRMTKTFTKDNNKVAQSRISTLTQEQIGYHKITNFKQNGQPCKLYIDGTVMEVTLATPIVPNSSATLSLEFDSQLPEQIRRSGRNSAEGVALSMTQWYPKLAEYDFEGWHTDPYIAREFHGVFADFDVKITIDKKYTVGGTGYLQNKNQIGHGYQDEGVEVKIPKKQKKLTWHFVAHDVHDFAWAADDEYLHDILIGENGVELHFLYKNNPEIIDNWKKLQPKTNDLLRFFNTHIGTYPYKQYSVIQGGDGGMEYAMCTLITGHRSLASLIGVTAHELAHVWFQGILAFNESKHYWMDEGFTTYISDLAVSSIMDKKLQEDENPFQTTYNSYYLMVASQKEQPLTTHADRFELNRIHSIAAYSKGAMFLTQLGYLVGEDNLSKILKRFYDEYKFTHPNPNDFKRVAEKVSGAVLDWYLVDWTQTTNTIDYGIKEVKENQNTTAITLERIGLMPMPIQIEVETNDGAKSYYYIPLNLMRYTKTDFSGVQYQTLPRWTWAHPTYTFELNISKKDIKSININPTKLMADINSDNDIFQSK
ncbi:MAG: M1 family metallopeptidase [Bacteroidota bacterium]|nr:M1 family metallopeptidase [Bacteroidota bacterium]